MSEMLDNDVFKIVRIDGEMLSGDANKLKLLMTSYAVIMEVQETYIKEEIIAKKQEKIDEGQRIENANLNRKDLRNAKSNIKKMGTEIASLEASYLIFSQNRTRFMEIARKALKLPVQNFEQLLEQGWVGINSEEVSLSDLDSFFEQSQESLTDKYGTTIFSNIDSDTIRKEVERAMNEKQVVYADDTTSTVKDYFINNVTSENFDQEVKDLAANIKEGIDDKKQNEITVDDVPDIFARAEAMATGNESVEMNMESIRSNELENQEMQAVDFTVPDDAVSDFQPSPSLLGNNSVSLISDFTIAGFDSSNDPELLELEKQIEEAQGLVDNSKSLLTAKEKEEEELGIKKDDKLKEAQEKYSEASEVMRKRREAEILRKKSMLQSLREQAESVKEQIRIKDASINSLNSEINGYEQSIKKSQEIINGGHTK